MIKLLIGGSPCTHWSIAQKNNRETEPKGLGWELFKNYLIAKEKFKPDFFLYENNKSAAQPIKDQISTELNVDLMHINSALVSAQNRQRFYAFNWKVDQPEDRGILLRDILESGDSFGARGEKAYALTAPYWKGDAPDRILEKHQRTMVAEPVYALSNEYFKGGQDSNLIGMTTKGEGKYRNGNQPSQQYRVYSCDGKSQVVNTLANENYIVPFEKRGEPIRIGDIGSTAQAHRVYSCEGKSVTINAGGGGQGGKTGLYACPATGFEKNVYLVSNGFITIKDKQYPINLPDGLYIIRKLTVTECCRLQTLPDDYCRAVSNSQAYKGLGNGWTAEVIIHILNGVLKDIPRNEEIVVLSMYDDIGTGRYCLDKMGFTKVRYYAYEIDKYAKQVAMSNYPGIIQCGDAFDLRHPDWTIGY